MAGDELEKISSISVEKEEEKKPENMLKSRILFCATVEIILKR